MLGLMVTVRASRVRVRARLRPMVRLANRVGDMIMGRFGLGFGLQLSSGMQV